ncbi:hypothetical protein LWI28_015666 [Acer negundo]|uniref:Receptor-like serine/threonine-protein kinase n=1 Tax=Acer negundo TaxID=4023 RepID=A0AAD5NSF7_ACENE|nr:hypothetical protein LWI28_015666 [Acer negundo]
MKNKSWFVFSVFFICFSLKSHVSIGADTISANQSLSGDQTIVSAGGVFALGFFKPGNSSNYYIGIWYKKMSRQNVVWVANRDKPISDRYSSVLRFTNGNLVLFNESKKPIWSTNLNSTTTTSTSIEALLLNEGNLVLRDRSKNISDHLWESFDHPTNIWLPGMKFGQNKRTKVNQFLTSWKNTEDPATGLFSLELHPDGSDQYVIVWNRSQLYWNSGIWNGQIFSLVPEMVYLINNSVYNFGYVSNENERYFIYSVNDPNLITQFIIDSSGQIQQMYWLEASKSWFIFWSQPRRPCEVYAYCGPFGSCSEQTQPFCGCLQGFKPTSDYNWNLLQDYSGGCARKTQLQCGNDSLSNGKRDRFLANRNMVFPKNLQSVSAGSIKECETTCLNNCSCSAYSYENGACSIWIEKLLGLQKLPQGNNTNGKTIYIKLAASEVPSAKNNKGTVIGGGAAGSVALVVILGLLTFMYLRRRKRIIKATKPVEGSLMAFSYKDLQNATKNFSEKLGGGGFGSVFKGVLPDSSVVAVKKLERIGQGEKQFRTEVSTIGNIQHVNLIRLRGFCSEDFGLAKLLGREFSRVLTTLRGTRGYLAPEWISGVAITAKADVYSYGMMLFEFISGRRNSEQSEDGTVEFFPTWAASKITEGGDVLSLVDPSLEGNVDAEELSRFCKMACWCVQADETHRPSMGQVVQILEGVLDMDHPPIPRSLQIYAKNQELVVFFNESSSSHSSQTRCNNSAASSQVKSNTSSTIS